MEFGNQLQLETRRLIAIDGDREASLAVYVAGDVAIQPFLLIVRTLHIVTLVQRFGRNNCVLTAPP